MTGAQAAVFQPPPSCFVGGTLEAKPYFSAAQVWEGQEGGVVVEILLERNRVTASAGQRSRRAG